MAASSLVSRLLNQTCISHLHLVLTGAKQRQSSGRRRHTKLFSFEPSLFTTNICLNLNMALIPLGCDDKMDHLIASLARRELASGPQFTTAYESWYMRGWEESRREESTSGATAVSYYGNAAVPAIPTNTTSSVQRRCIRITDCP